jgi:hypothetical protein
MRRSRDLLQSEARNALDLLAGHGECDLGIIGDPGLEGCKNAVFEAIYQSGVDPDCLIKMGPAILSLNYGMIIDIYYVPVPRAPRRRCDSNSR